jgi:O-antigen/teichoic acid export membrane protein
MPPTLTDDLSSAESRSALDRQLVSSVAWTALARWGSQIISWGAMLLLARLLSPGDFGLYGMTWLLSGFVSVVSEFGIGTAIVVMRELTPHQIRQANSVALLLGVAGSVITLAASIPTAAFFHNPALGPLVAVLGIQFAMAAFRLTPQAILTRDLKFKLIAGIEALVSVLQTAVCLLLALAGLRYWALAISTLIGYGAGSLAFCLASPCGFAKPLLRDIRSQMQFSWRLLVSRAAWFLYSNADFTVAGRVLGESALGVYNMAWNLANIPLDRVLTLVLRVTPSVFSKVQDDYSELRRYLRTLTEAMSLVVFPLGIGTALVADHAVAIFFDKRWAGMAGPLQLLAITGVFRCLFVLSLQIQTTVRDVRYTMWQSICGLAVFPPAFWYASRWGGIGIAGVWLCLTPVFNAPALYRVLRHISMPKREYLESIKPAGTASAAMILAVLAVRHSLISIPPVVEWVSECVSGAIVYVGVLFLFFRPRVDVFLNRALHRGRPA